MLSYRMEIRAPEEVAAEDPFGGRGVKLPHPPGMNIEAACTLIAKEFPNVPSVSFALVSWADAPGEAGAALREAWEGLKDKSRDGGI